MGALGNWRAFLLTITKKLKKNKDENKKKK